MMIKNSLLATALLSLALASGCAKGGNGAGNGISITVKDGNVTQVGVTMPIQFTADVSGTSNTAVAWTLSGKGCAGNSNPCGTIDVNSGLYQAPPSPPNPQAITITATSRADSTARGQLSVNVVPISVVVTPTAVTVGQSLVQQFTAVAVPDNVPQTFTWTCTPTGSCGTVVQDPNTSGLVVYTAPGAAQSSIVVTATSTRPTSSPSTGQSKVTVASSRLAAGTYAFQFSGYDSGNPVAAAGSFVLAANGTITAGIEDVLNAGVPHQYPISQVTYSPSSNNNNLGTLTLKLSGGPTNTYTAVLTSSGIFRMIESDGAGTGSGVLQKSAPGQFNTGNPSTQTFAFGFTGVDAAVNGKRVGYVGLLPMNGIGNSGTITGGLLDANDNGNDVCGSQPCNVTGSYTQPNTSLPTWWQLTLSSVTTQTFDFFVSGGQTQTKTGPNSLTLYAISTDAVSGTLPALSGSMVYQVPMTYNNAAFVGSSVSSLAGANANVSLTLGSTDGSSSGSGGTGSFSGNFDQNNNGTIVSVSSFPSSTQSPSPYTYVATNGNTGRYIFQMLGNPGANPVVLPIPFVLYASGVGRGFLLDQSSSAVITGTMDPQPAKAVFYTNTEMPGTYAAATVSNSNTNVVQPVVQNLLLTSPGGGVFNITGAQDGNQTVTGTYDLNGGGSGTGTITLTAPSASTSVIYALDFDVTNSVITDFMMMGTCTPQSPQTTCSTGPPSDIIFAQQ